jgi:hypothetical protein
MEGSTHNGRVKLFFLPWTMARTWTGHAAVMIAQISKLDREQVTRKERTESNTVRLLRTHGGRCRLDLRSTLEMEANLVRSWLDQIAEQNAQLKAWFAGHRSQCDSFSATCGGFSLFLPILA